MVGLAYPAVGIWNKSLLTVAVEKSTHLTSRPSLSIVLVMSRRARTLMSSFLRQFAQRVLLARAKIGICETQCNNQSPGGFLLGLVRANFGQPKKCLQAQDPRPAMTRLESEPKLRRAGPRDDLSDGEFGQVRRERKVTADPPRIARESNAFPPSFPQVWNGRQGVKSCCAQEEEQNRWKKWVFLTAIQANPFRSAQSDGAATI